MPAQKRSREASPPPTTEEEEEKDDDLHPENQNQNDEEADEGDDSDESSSSSDAEKDDRLLMSKGIEKVSTEIDDGQYSNLAKARFEASIAQTLRPGHIREAAWEKKDIRAAPPLYKEICRQRTAEVKRKKPKIGASYFPKAQQWDANCRLRDENDSEMNRESLDATAPYCSFRQFCLGEGLAASCKRLKIGIASLAWRKMAGFAGSSSSLKADWNLFNIQMKMMLSVKLLHNQGFCDLLCLVLNAVPHHQISRRGCLATGEFDKCTKNTKTWWKKSNRAVAFSSMLTCFCIPGKPKEYFGRFECIGESRDLAV
nr:putative E3 ubiquitin-protein ligase RING1a isoform X2 [Ipomoea batatas]